MTVARDVLAVLSPGLCHLLVAAALTLGTTATEHPPNSGESEGLTGALSESPLTERWAVTEGRVLLPCDVTPPYPGDSPILVLVSKGDTPVYSVDARGGGSFSSAVQWSSPKVIGDRGKFLTVGGGGLQLQPVKKIDQSDYHCRVEFHDSPTRNSRVRLHLVVSPSIPVVLDELGLEVSGIIGPYTLGSTITLACRVTGGYPLPRVTWWHERFLLDDISEVTDGTNTINKITLPNLSRQHLDRKLTCQASNSNLTKPVQTAVVLNMSFPPASVDIVGSDGALSEGQQYTLLCQSTGSRPPVTLAWLQDGVKLNHSMDVVLRGQTQSTLLLKPTREDNGRVLACRGTNPLLPTQSKEDTRILDVRYPPKLQLRLGINLNILHIKERDDVYFECDASGNPEVTTVQWYHDGLEVHSNKSAGIILSHRSLVLQRVQRTVSGAYACGASNSEGSALSNTLTLNVHYAPVCAAVQQWVYGSGRRELVNVTCHVEADPPPHTFAWSLNTSSTDLLDVPRSRTYNLALRSVLAYTPHSPLDYGSLLCWAENSVGRQQQPCVFQVVPAAVPEPVYNCSAWHNSSAAGQVVIRCWPGWNGGLEQTFSLEVREGGSGSMVASLSEQLNPRFTVTGLKPGQEYMLQVMAGNSQGSTQPVTLTHLTPIDIAEKRLSKTPTNVGGIGVPTAVGVLAGVACVLLLCCSMMVLLLRVRGTAARRVPKDTRMSISDNADEDGCLKSDGEPDVILVSGNLRGTNGDHQITQTSELDEDIMYSQRLSTGVTEREMVPACASSDPLRRQSKSGNTGMRDQKSYDVSHMPPLQLHCTQSLAYGSDLQSEFPKPNLLYNSNKTKDSRIKFHNSPPHLDNKNTSFLTLPSLSKKKSQSERDNSPAIESIPDTSHLKNSSQWVNSCPYRNQSPTTKGYLPPTDEGSNFCPFRKKNDLYLTKDRSETNTLPNRKSSLNRGVDNTTNVSENYAHDTSRASRRDKQVNNRRCSPQSSIVESPQRESVV